MRHFTILAVALVAGCAQNGGDSTRGGGGGPEPVFVEGKPGTPAAIYVEPGQRWNVQHCIPYLQGQGNPEIEVCGDASHLYQTNDGKLCGPVLGNPFNGADAAPNPIGYDCDWKGEDFDRWVTVY